MEGHNPELVQLLNALAFPTDQATYTQADNALQAGLKQPGEPMVCHTRQRLTLI
jgi:hypothetical protein